MAQVVLRGLNKKYDEVHAVKDVNLTIRDKEFMVLVGPSGCGKTTTLTDGSGALFAEAGGIRIKVPAAATQSLMPYKGQGVTLGVRPEDLRVGASSDSSDLAFETLVEVVEPLGSEILLDTSAAGQHIVARVEPAVRTQPHEKIRLTFIPERIHFFDAKTEAVIR